MLELVPENSKHILHLLQSFWALFHLHSRRSYNTGLILARAYLRTPRTPPQISRVQIPRVDRKRNASTAARGVPGIGLGSVVRIQRLYTEDPARILASGHACFTFI